MKSLCDEIFTTFRWNHSVMKSCFAGLCRRQKGETREEGGHMPEWNRFAMKSSLRSDEITAWWNPALQGYSCRAWRPRHAVKASIWEGGGTKWRKEREATCSYVSRKLVVDLNEIALRWNLHYVQMKSLRDEILLCRVIVVGRRACSRRKKCF